MIASRNFVETAEITRSRPGIGAISRARDEEYGTAPVRCLENHPVLGDCRR
jgi:hypothetical protein